MAVRFPSQLPNPIPEVRFPEVCSATALDLGGHSSQDSVPAHAGCRKPEHGRKSAESLKDMIRPSLARMLSKNLLVFGFQFVVKSVASLPGELDKRRKTTM